MEREELRKAIRLSYGISLGFSLVLSLAFLAVTSLIGDYDAMSRYGGAIWVFILGLIIALPTVTPMIKRKYNPDKEQGRGNYVAV